MSGIAEALDPDMARELVDGYASDDAPYRDLGFGTVIARLPAPFDRETIDRIGEVGALLGG